jgi:hypothetical protein
MERRDPRDSKKHGQNPDQPVIPAFEKVVRPTKSQPKPKPRSKDKPISINGTIKSEYTSTLPPIRLWLKRKRERKG